MASRYLPLALTVPWSRPHDRLTRWGVRSLVTLWLACSTGLILTAGAAADNRLALRPYTAQYKTTARGIKLNLTRKLKLATGDSDSYILTNGGKIMVVGFHEVSVFTVEADRILPRSYVYQGTGLIDRRRELQFAQKPGSIRSLHKKRWYELPYSRDTLDRMSQLEQLRLSLLNQAAPRQAINLRVADGKRVKDSRLVLVAREMLQTPLGPVDTLHFERLHNDQARKSDVWLAPQWDYLMVKTVHVEDGNPVEMILTSATIEGVPVAANQPAEAF